MDSTAFAGLRWREVGPFRGGRSVAVAGSVARPNEYWMGTTGAGVFKTTDGGRSWAPMTERYFGGTVGAVQVAASNPDIVWVGGGESDIRGNAAPGDGVWLTSDAGRTWKRITFFDVKNHVNRIRIHPTNPNIVWVGVLGHAFGRNDQRGVFKTTDGGKSWSLILKGANAFSGASDLSMDPNNPRILYTTFWEAQRYPHKLNSGGPDSSIYRSMDGGDTWQEITRNQGLPKGVLISRRAIASTWSL